MNNSFIESMTKLGQKVEEHLDNYIKDLDQLSEDILTIEHNFRGQKIKSFKLYFDSYLIDQDESELVEIDEFLVWNGDKLLYIIENEDSECANVAPLIEAKRHTRLKIRDLFTSNWKIEETHINDKGDELFLGNIKRV